MFHNFPFGGWHLFPAHAGVILRYKIHRLLLRSVPRTRGGDPTSMVVTMLGVSCSPHTRG